MMSKLKQEILFENKKGFTPTVAKTHSQVVCMKMHVDKMIMAYSNEERFFKDCQTV